MQNVKTQLKMCKEKMLQIHPQGDYNFEIFNEEDLSSTIKYTKRPELQKMLRSVSQGDTVIVYKLDRLSRDTIEMVTIYRKIVKECKGNIISLTDPHSDEFSVSIMGLIAQRERESISMRTKDALKTKKDRGERYCGTLPYGWGLHETKLVPIKDGDKIVMKRGILIPIHEEQETIKTMKRFQAQGASYLMIEKCLNELGHKNREGNPWHKMSIYRILKRISEASPDSASPQEHEIPLLAGG